MVRLLLLALLLSACAESSDSLPTPSATLRPRGQLTATPTRAAVMTGEPIETPGATATPFVHVIQEGDTLLGIAFQYGVELAELLLANPGVNPRFLSVGQELIVPLAGAQGPIPTATPVPLTLSPVHCFGDPTGAYWCLLTASSSGSDIEGVVALVTLIDEQGTALQTEPAYSPLNLLRAGGSIPLVAVFDPPVPQHVSASATLISALLAGEVEARYPALQITIDEQEISQDRRSVSVSGGIALASEQPLPENDVRIVGMALGASGELLGFRVLESFRPDELQDGLPFAFEIGSLDLEIVEVVVLAEAR